MKPLVMTVMDIAKGSNHRRAVALLTLACWFVMGAFVATTIGGYVGAESIPHNLTAVTGGTLMACIAACLKAA